MVIALQVKEPKPSYRRSTPVIVDTFSGEAVAVCPKCKTFETLWFVRDTLVQTLKFTQRGNLVYHDCGADEPCRLYRNYLKVLPTEVGGRRTRGAPSRVKRRAFDAVLSTVAGGPALGGL